MRTFDKMAISIWYCALLFLAILLVESLYATSVSDLIDQLTIAIDTHDPNAIQEVSLELVNRGDTVIPELERRWESGNRGLKSAIISILAKIKTENSTKTLLNIATEQKDKSVVINAMEILQYRKLDLDVSSRSVEKLLEHVEENDLHRGPLAARILGNMKRVNPQVRTESILSALQRETAKCNIGMKQPLLPDSYCTESQHKVRQYVFAVEDIGAAAIPFIWQEVRDPNNVDAHFKEYLFVCLGLCGEKSVADNLQKTLLESVDGHARALSALAIGRLGDDRAIESLKRALADEFRVVYESDVRGPWGNEEIYPVREEAASALQKLGVRIVRQGNVFRTGE